MNFKVKFRKNKGITLIALVVTIIVLLILAGISITMLTGQNGILNRAGEAKTTNGVAQGEELIKVSVMDALTRGTGELTDENLRKALSSNLGTEGEDYEIVGSEDCGWTVTIKENDKDYKISSTGKIGEIEKVEASSSEWRVEGNAVVEYLGSSNDIVVPNYVDGVKITEIGAKIFQNSEKTGTLTISEGIKVIDEYAFSRSKFTGTPIFPNTLVEIKEYAFEGCTEFSGDLELPNSLEKIGQFAFAGWTGNLNDLIVPCSIKEFGYCAFVGCSGFKGNLVLKEGIKNLGDSAFMSCSGFSGTLKIPNSVETIGSQTFCGCTGFTGDLVIPDSVKVIKQSAFISCSGFSGKLILPKGVEIEGFAFCGCSGFTGDLIIPDYTKFPQTDSFSGFESLGTVDVGEGVENLYFNRYISAKRVIMKSNTASFGFLQCFNKIESCWLTSKAIANLPTNRMFEYLSKTDFTIYTDATENDPNWPSGWNPNSLNVVYETSLEKYHELTD